MSNRVRIVVGNSDFFGLRRRWTLRLDDRFGDLAQNFEPFLEACPGSFNLGLGLATETTLLMEGFDTDGSTRRPTQISLVSRFNLGIRRWSKISRRRWCWLRSVR